MVPDHEWIRQRKLELDIVTVKIKFKPRLLPGLRAST